mgnify:CR=1 FL=1
MSSVKYFESLPRQLKSFFERFPPSVKYASAAVSTHAADANPFIANKHPETQRYHDPVYSLRRSSELYKLAHRHGVESLLPPLPAKLFFEEKYENKTFMKGVLLPKGHKHELRRQERDEARAKGIAGADAQIAKIKGQKFNRRKAQRTATTWY